jgi:GGDEF domain-containing protein
MNAIQENSGQTGHSVCLQPEELQSVLALAVEAVNSFCLNSDHCVQRLGEIEDQIEDASSVAAIRVLRFRLDECLQRLREEASHQRKQMTGVLDQLRTQLQVAQGARKAASLSPANDALSGLETRASAELAFAAAIELRTPAYGAVFVADCLHQINAQYGFSTGDQMLRTLANHLVSHLVAGDRLFRWTGPVFVALLERVEKPHQVRDEINKLTSVKLAAAVQIGNRSVSLPIPCTALLLPLTEMARLADLTARMDAFIAEQARH